MKNFYPFIFKLFAIVNLLSIYLPSYGQITETFNSPGTNTWLCPANVTEVVVECWGGGGGGGNSANNTINGGSGGGGGAYAKKTFTVIEGNIYYLTVGAGGAGAPAFSTTLALSGQDSWFNSVNQIPANSSAALAKGGVRGLNNSVANPNNGGSLLNSFGDIVFAGGNGYQGSSTGGGGGGSSASLLGTGVSSINYLGAIANSGGGNGGNAGITTSSNGSPGSVPGGGGGGSDDSQARIGGSGANGLVKLTYYINCTGTPNSGIVTLNNPNGCEGSSLTLTASNLTTGQGISFQWQISNDNILWTDILGATSTSCILAPNTSSYFRIKSICSFSGFENFSQSVQYIVYPIPNTPIISVSGSTTFCQGNNVVISSNIVSGLNYQWKNNSVDLPGETNSTFSASTSGVYSLVVTNIYGCTATSPSTIVTVNPVPNAAVSSSGPTTFCQGDNVILSVSLSAFETFQWQNNGINISGSSLNSYTATSTGSYSIIINNTYGCASSSNPINVTVSTYPNASIDNQGISSICEGGTVLLSANSGPGLTYLWSNGATSASYLANSAGSYSVIVTNSSGCSTASNPVTIAVNLINTTLYSTNTSMNTGYVKSTGTKTTGNLAVSTSTTYGRGWAKFPLTSIPSGSVITDVTIKFYIYGGAPSTTANTIRGFTGDPVTMNGTNLYSSIGSGTIYNTSTWTIGTTTTPSLNIKVLTSGGVNYVQNQLATGYVNFGFVAGSSSLHSIYGSNSTTYSVRLEISYIPPAPSASITSTSNTIFCQGNSVTLNANVGTGLSYQWKNNGINVFGTNSSFSALSTGNYTVQVTNGSGCSSISNPITVIVNPPPLATLSNSGSLTFCQGSSVTLNANIGSGLNYQWKKDGVNLIGANATSYSAITTGSYSVLITDINGCSSNSNILSVTVNPIPNPIIFGNTSFCENDSSVLSINPNEGVNYQWSVNGINIIGATNYNYVLTTPGSYSTNVINSFGCSAASPSVSITVNPFPITSITASNTTTFCQGGSTVLSNSNSSGITYQWFKNGIQINGANSSNYNASTSGNYNLYIIDNNWCSNFSSNSITVSVLSTPSLSIFGDSAICLGETSTLIATSNGNIVWSGNISQNTIQVSPNNTSTYSVISTGSNGCQTQEQITIQVHYPSDTTIYTSSFGSYILNGVVYNESGVYTQNLQTVFGCDSLITLNLNIEVNGVDETYLSKIVIFPNPNSTGEFILNNSDEKEFDVEVVNDQFGREIAFSLEKFSLSNYRITIPYAPGIYFVGIRIGEKVYYRKCSII